MNSNFTGGIRSLMGDKDTMEGYVVRPAGAFDRNDFSRLVGKFVRANHVQSETHWKKNWVPNAIGG